MKKLNLSILLLVFLASSTILAQTNVLPAKAISRPKYLMNRDNTRKEWEQKIAMGDYGVPSGEYWDVYSDRCDNFTYTEPSAASQKQRKLAFMDQVRIARVENGFAQVYKVGETSKFPTIKSDAENYGWIEVSHLLLWNSCPVNRYKIYDKGVVVNDLDEMKADDKIENVKNPIFKEDPRLMKSTRLEARKLEFYFIYKEDANAYLVGKENQISGSNSEKAVILGWIGKNSITPWNKRICLEPIYGKTNRAKLGNLKPSIFLDKDQALEYRNTGSMDKVLVAAPVGDRRMSPYSFRYPILSTANNIHNVVTIGSMTAADVISNADATRKWEELKKRQANINVVFVIDGTSSMKEYYRPIVEALIKSTKRDDLSDRFKFGAVVYRDYIDKGEAIEYRELTKNVNEITSFLTQVQAKSYPGDDLPEAMYLGLETALDKTRLQKDESNFVILVGDAGNHIKDPQGRTLDKIVEKLAYYSVNLVAFQANNGHDKTYTDFILQVNDMIRRSIKSVVGSTVDFATTRPGYRETVLKGTNEKTIIVGGVAFCDIGQSQDPKQLERLVTDKIGDFDTQIKDWLFTLERLKNGGGNDTWTPEIIQWMKNKGFTPAQIKMLQQAQLKINGYTSREVKNPAADVFDYIVFMSNSEFAELLENLNIVYKPVSANRRGNFQDALKSLALSYVGQNNIDEYQVDEIMKDILGGVPYVGNSLRGIKIKDITERKKLSDQEFDRYMSDFKQSITRLENLQKDRDYYFESNGQRYYWIPVDEMP